jgi:hypothetical protein
MPRHAFEPPQSGCVSKIPFDCAQRAAKSDWVIAIIELEVTIGFETMPVVHAVSGMGVCGLVEPTVELIDPDVVTAEVLEADATDVLEAEVADVVTPVVATELPGPDVDAATELAVDACVLDFEPPAPVAVPEVEPDGFSSG